VKISDSYVPALKKAPDKTTVLQGTEATRAADIGGVKETVVWDEK
jgi:hypothetical protein